MADEALVQAMVDALLAARFAGWRRMVAGYKNADGSITMSGAGVGKVWARSPEDSRGGTAVWGSAAYPDAPLIVGPGFDGAYEVKGADWLTASISFGEGARIIDQPPGMGELMPDTVPIKHFKPGRVELSPTGGLNIRIAHFWHRGGLWNSDADQDMSSYEPGTADYICWVVPYLDPDTNTVSAATTTPVFGEKPDLEETDIETVTLPAGVIPLGAFTLSNGQANISTSRFADDDRRVVLSSWDDSGSASSVLDSMIDAEGGVMIDASGSMMTES